MNKNYKDYLFLLLYGVILFAYHKCAQTNRINSRETFVHTCSTYFKAGIDSGLCIPIPGAEGTIVDSGADWGKCCMGEVTSATDSSSQSDDNSVSEPPELPKIPKPTPSDNSDNSDHSNGNLMECECPNCPAERKWLQWVGILSISFLGLYVSYLVYKLMKNRKKQKPSYTSPPPPRGSYSNTPGTCDNVTASQIESKSCKDILAEKGIETRKDYLRWAVRNHPDKTQDPCATKRFQKVDGCWRR